MISLHIKQEIEETAGNPAFTTDFPRQLARIDATRGYVFRTQTLRELAGNCQLFKAGVGTGTSQEGRQK